MLLSRSGPPFSHTIRIVVPRFDFCGPRIPWEAHRSTATASLRNRRYSLPGPGATGMLGLGLKVSCCDHLLSSIMVRLLA